MRKVQLQELGDLACELRCLVGVLGDAVLTSMIVRSYRHVATAGVKRPFRHQLGPLHGVHRVLGEELEYLLDQLLPVVDLLGSAQAPHRNTVIINSRLSSQPPPGRGLILSHRGVCRDTGIM